MSYNPIPGYFDGGLGAVENQKSSKRFHGQRMAKVPVYEGSPHYSSSHNGVLGGVVHYLTHIRLSRLIGTVLLILIIIPLLTHYYISNMASESDSTNVYLTRKYLDNIRIEDDKVKVIDLKFRIEELEKIKASVNNELKDLEMKRQKMLAEVSGYNSHIEKLKSEYESTNKDLQQLKISIENTKLEQEEIIKRNTPELQAPHRILPGARDDVTIPGPKSPQMCRMYNCFDHSRCSATSQFPVYLYDPVDYQFSTADIDDFIKTSVSHALNASPHFTFDSLSACIYIVLLGDLEERGKTSYINLQQKLHNLPYWHGDGRNHVLLNLARNYSNRDIFDGVDTGRAVVVQSSFTELQYREDFDILVPPLLGSSRGDVWDQLPMQVPAKRKHLLSFRGEFKVLADLIRQSVLDGVGSDNKPNGKLSYLNGANSVNDLLNFEKTIVDTLKRMQSIYRDDGFHFEFSCERERIFGMNGEWALCGPDAHRERLLRDSTFSLILGPVNSSVISTALTQTRIYEALKFGAIPVILGDNVKLPFSEILNWKDAAIVLPKARVTELHFYMRSLSDTDILSMRRQGRIYWETYLGSTQSVMNTILAILRTRLHIPAFPMLDEPSPSVFNDTYRPLIEDVIGE